VTITTSKQQLFLKSLLEHYHPGRAQEFLAYWDSPESVEKINEMDDPHGSPKDLLINPKKAIQQIHYSWIAEAMEKLPNNLYPTILASLKNPQKQILCDQNNIPLESLKDIPLVTQSFLCEKLYRQIEDISDILPLEFTPQYPLSQLLKLEKNLILEMFDLLGLHDLAVKAKHIVDKKTLGYIYNSLTPIRKKLFDIFLRQADKAQLPKIDLSNWTGDPKILKKMLHRRGILRLATALSGYNKDFMWHFSRRLDTGRGRIILRYYNEEETPLAPVLTEQVQFIMNILTQKSES
jgi:hypothetical protein